MSTTRSRNYKNNKDLSFKDRIRLVWQRERKTARQQSLEGESRRNLDEWDLMGSYFEETTSIDDQPEMDTFIDIIVDSPSQPSTSSIIHHDPQQLHLQQQEQEQQQQHQQQQQLQFQFQFQQQQQQQLTHTVHLMTPS
ncbi:nuclear transcription factor Y subunit beta-like [Panonychus citri]|uniref:nuclear transcription factor Y subunit beta-like n=1 Tax=Panonychus citri TaxID=50023 RepID=UPI00230733FC|nr:nuclear transcription factor Y subunit beta-like [Panonychus citri]